MTRALKTVILAAGSGSRFQKEGVETPKPLIELGGLSLLERAVRNCVKAGLSEFLIVIGSRGELLRNALETRLSDVRVQWVLNPDWEKGNGTSVLAAAPYLGQEHFLVLMSDHLLFPSILKRLSLAPLDLQNTLLAIDRKRVVCDLDDATKVRLSGDRVTEINKTLDPYDALDVGAAVCSPSFIEGLRQAAQNPEGRCAHTDGMRALASQGKLLVQDIGSDRWEDVDSLHSHRVGEKLLFQSLRKPTDGFMSQHVERRLSLAITRLLARTNLRPNQVTLFVIGIGALSAYLFAQPSWGMRVLGSLLFWMSSFLDGCDGELARLKFMESRLGGWLDLWSDNIVHMLVFSGMGVGLWRETQQPYWVAVGLSAALGVLISVSWVSWTTVRKKSVQGPLFTSVSSATAAPQAAQLTKVADALSRRDFIFGVIFLALLGWLPWFLWAAAIGSHVYWMILLLIAFKSRRSV